VLSLIAISLLLLGRPEHPVPVLYTKNFEAWGVERTRGAAAVKDKLGKPVILVDPEFAKWVGKPAIDFVIYHETAHHTRWPEQYWKADPTMAQIHELGADMHALAQYLARSRDGDLPSVFKSFDVGRTKASSWHGGATERVRWLKGSLAHLKDPRLDRSDDRSIVVTSMKRRRRSNDPSLVELECYLVNKSSSTVRVDYVGLSRLVGPGVNRYINDCSGALTIPAHQKHFVLLLLVAPKLSGQNSVETLFPSYERQTMSSRKLK
jgi:hypothetical protein